VLVCVRFSRALGGASGAEESDRHALHIQRLNGPGVNACWAAGGGGVTLSEVVASGSRG